MLTGDSLTGLDLYWRLNTFLVTKSRASEWSKQTKCLLARLLACLRITSSAWQIAIMNLCIVHEPNLTLNFTKPTLAFRGRTKASICDACDTKGYDTRS